MKILIAGTQPDSKIDELFVQRIDKFPLLVTCDEEKFQFDNEEEIVLWAEENFYSFEIMEV